MYNFTAVKIYTDKIKAPEIVYNFTNTGDESRDGFVAYGSMLIMNKRLEKQGLHKEFFFDIKLNINNMV